MVESFLRKILVVAILWMRNPYVLERTKLIQYNMFLKHIVKGGGKTIKHVDPVSPPFRNDPPYDRKETSNTQNDTSNSVPFGLTTSSTPYYADHCCSYDKIIHL